PFAIARFTYRRSRVRLKLFSAFAIADRTTRPSGSEVDLGWVSRIAIASSAVLPVMRSVTSLAFRGDSRRNFALAFTSMAGARLHGRRALGRAGARSRRRTRRRRGRGRRGLGAAVP